MGGSLCSRTGSQTDRAPFPDGEVWSQESDQKKKKKKDEQSSKEHEFLLHWNSD